MVVKGEVFNTFSLPLRKGFFFKPFSFLYNGETKGNWRERNMDKTENNWIDLNNPKTVYDLIGEAFDYLEGDEYL